MSMRVPRLRSFSSFASGAFTGTIAVAAIPSRRAIQASPSALLPELVV